MFCSNDNRNSMIINCHITFTFAFYGDLQILLQFSLNAKKKKFVFVLTGRNGVCFVILILSWGLGLGGRKLVELRSKEYIRIYIVRCANLDYNNKISCWLSYSPSLWIAFYIAKKSDNDDIYFCSKLFLASKFFIY